MSKIAKIVYTKTNEAPAAVSPHVNNPATNACIIGLSNDAMYILNVSIITVIF